MNSYTRKCNSNSSTGNEDTRHKHLNKPIMRPQIIHSGKKNRFMIRSQLTARVRWMKSHLQRRVYRQLQRLSWFLLRLYNCAFMSYLNNAFPLTWTYNCNFSVTCFCKKAVSKLTFKESPVLKRSLEQVLSTDKRLKQIAYKSVGC